MQESTPCSHAYLAPSKGCFIVDSTQPDSVLLLLYSKQFNSNCNSVWFLQHPQYLLFYTSCVNAVWRAQTLTSFEKGFYQKESNVLPVYLWRCFHRGTNITTSGSKLLMKNVLVCFPNPLPRKIHLRDLVLCKKITYLSLFGYDCTESTWTNVNERIHEELGVVVYIPLKGVKYCYYFFKKSTVYFRHISVVPEICSMGENMNHSASLRKKYLQLFHKDWMRSLSVTTAECFPCQCVTPQSTSFICKTTAFIKTHWLVKQSLRRQLYSSQLSIPK